jgi:hypothetical protein
MMSTSESKLPAQVWQLRGAGNGSLLDSRMALYGLKQGAQMFQPLDFLSLGLQFIEI